MYSPVYALFHLTILIGLLVTTIKPEAKDTFWHICRVFILHFIKMYLNRN